MASKKGKGKAVEAPSGSAPTHILDVPPDSIVTFDIEDMDNLAENYEQCVKDIISIMERDTDVKYTFIVNGKEVVIPVTPGKNDRPSGIYMIELKNGGKSLYLVANKYQTWFIGIITHNSQMFEIEPKVMRGSVSLETTGMYTDLLRGKDIADLKLGYYSLLSAFYILTNYTGGEPEGLKKRKEAIAIILMIFFEGPRFLDVFELVKKAFTDGSSIELGADNQTQIGDWCDHSRDFYQVKGDMRRLIISAETSDKVKRVAHKLRIMCRSQWDSWHRDDKSSTSTSKA